MNEPRGDATRIARAHRRGMTLLVLSLVLGVAFTGWLQGWVGSPHFSVTAGVGGGAATGGAVPRARQGLVANAENRGQVLFGRSCDSCHSAGGEGRGVALVTPEFRRDFKAETDIIQLVRDGTCRMPAYSRAFLADGDLAEIAKFTLARARAAPGAQASPPLTPLDGRGILETKCLSCHNTIDKPLDARDVQLLFALDEMAKCAGLTAEQKAVLRTFLRSQQRP
ncbi:MAG: cytochrome c [Chloroflexota bacterium]